MSLPKFLIKSSLQCYPSADVRRVLRLNEYPDGDDVTDVLSQYRLVVGFRAK